MKTYHPSLGDTVRKDIEELIAKDEKLGVIEKARRTNPMGISYCGSTQKGSK